MVSLELINRFGFSAFLLDFAIKPFLVIARVELFGEKNDVQDFVRIETDSRRRVNSKLFQLFKRTTAYFEKYPSP